MKVENSWPDIDPRIKHVGVSKLRDLNATALREMSDSIYVFRDGDDPLSVMVSYEQYLKMQQVIQADE